MAVPASVQAKAFTVTSTLDEADANPAMGFVQVVFPVPVRYGPPSKRPMPFLALTPSN